MLVRVCSCCLLHQIKPSAGGSGAFSILLHCLSRLVTKKGDQEAYSSGWEAENIAEVLVNKSAYKGTEFRTKYVKTCLLSESYALYHFTEELVLYIHQI